MDKFMTYDGEQPIWLDDLNFIDLSIRATIGRLVYAILQSPTNNCILQGCQITESREYISWTDGVIMFNGEILPIKAGRTTAKPGQTYSFMLVEEYDPSGERTFRDGQSHNCYQKRSVTIAYNGDYTHTVDGMPILHDEMEALYNTERKYQIYKSQSSDNYQTKAEIIISAGGLYLSGTLTALPKLGEDAKIIIPKTQIDTSFLQSVSWPKGLKTAVLSYKPNEQAYEQYLGVEVLTQVESGHPYISMQIPTARQLVPGFTSFFIRLN